MEYEPTKITSVFKQRAINDLEKAGFASVLDHFWASRTADQIAFIKDIIEKTECQNVTNNPGLITDPITATRSQIDQDIETLNKK